ncbi:MAG: SGNH/GDSL hydrolase family protein [Bacteroidia bacterium]|nr:SGNH/GDSL hydrolase family protein [Bacteroidia bacterium]
MIGVSAPTRITPTFNSAFLAQRIMQLYSVYQKDSIQKAIEKQFLTQVTAIDTSITRMRYWATDTVLDPSAVIDYSVPIIEGLQGKTIMIIGESNVNAGFTQYFGAFVKQSGVKYKSYSSVGISIITWCRTAKLKRIVAYHKPDLVIFMIGGNDVYTPYPKYIKPDIECMIKHLNGVPFYWITPPNLRWYEREFGKKTPLIPVIEEVIGCERTFRADTLTLQMAGDQKHTHFKGGKKLAELFFMWLKEKYEKQTSSKSLDTLLLKE